MGGVTLRIAPAFAEASRRLSFDRTSRGHLNFPVKAEITRLTFTASTIIDNSQNEYMLISVKAMDDAQTTKTETNRTQSRRFLL